MTLSSTSGAPPLVRPPLAPLAIGGLFWAYSWITKETPALYAGQPWRDDPYDALVSFDLAALPILIALAAVPALVLLGSPVAPRRRMTLIRLDTMLVALVAATAAAEWVAIAFQADPHPGATPRMAWAAATLLVSAAAAGGCWRVLVARRALRASGAVPQRPEWAADLLALAALTRKHVPALVRPVLEVFERPGLVVLAAARERPMRTAAALALLTAVGATAPQILLEGYPIALAAWVLVVASCSFFVLLVVADRLVPLTESADGPLRPARLAVLTGAAAVPVTAAFRGALWWTIGTTSSAAGLPELIELTAVLPAAATAAVYLVALAMRTPARPRK